MISKCDRSLPGFTHVTIVTDKVLQTRFGRVCAGVFLLQFEQLGRDGEGSLTVRIGCVEEISFFQDLQYSRDIRPQNR